MKNKLLLTLIIMLLSSISYSYSRIWIGENENKMCVGIEVKYQLSDNSSVRFTNEIFDVKMNAVNSFTPGWCLFTTNIELGAIGFEHTCKHLFDTENFTRDVREKLYWMHNF